MKGKFWRKCVIGLALAVMTAFCGAPPAAGEWNMPDAMMVAGSVPQVSNPLWYLMPPPNAQVFYVTIGRQSAVPAASRLVLIAQGYVPDDYVGVIKEVQAAWLPLYYDEVTHATSYWLMRGMTAIYFVGGLKAAPPAVWTGSYAPLKAIIMPIPVAGHSTAAQKFYGAASPVPFYGPLCVPSNSHWALYLGEAKFIDAAAGQLIGYVWGNVLGWTMPDPDGIWRNIK